MKLKWEFVTWKGNPSMGKAWRAKVGRGYLWLLPFDVKDGVTYVSSFGVNSDDSFTGFLSGASIESAKEWVYDDARKHWVT